jgi:hypothetical protein
VRDPDREALQAPGGRYTIKYPVQAWDPEQGKVARHTKWEKVPLNKKGKPVKHLAEVLLADRLKTMHDGTFRELHEITFEQFADKWLQEYARGGVKPATYSGYESHIRVHLKPAFGALALKAIREDVIQGYPSSKLVAGAKPKSVKNHLWC